MFAICASCYFFFFNDTATTEIYTLSLHDALPIYNLARVYIVQGRFQESLGPLARAIEIDSTVTAFQHNLGIALKALKQDSATVDLSELARGFVEQTKSWH